MNGFMTSALLFADDSLVVAGLFDVAHWEQTLDRIGAKLPAIAMGAVIIVAFYSIARFVRNLITRVGATRKVNADAVLILADAVKWGIITVGIITGLGTLGIDVSAMVAGLGLTGLAIGIALKDVVSNSIAGIMILIFKPFYRGDRIAVTGLEGTVAQIDLRYTHLETADRRILIPNSNLLTNSIIVYRENETHSGRR
jgi:small-conductance mechanosensitive channel